MEQDFYGILFGPSWALWNTCVRFDWHVAVGTKLLGQIMVNGMHKTALLTQLLWDPPVLFFKKNLILLIPIWMYMQWNHDN